MKECNDFRKCRIFEDQKGGISLVGGKTPKKCVSLLLVSLGEVMSYAKKAPFMKMAQFSCIFFLDVEFDIIVGFRFTCYSCFFFLLYFIFYLFLLIEFGLFPLGVSNKFPFVADKKNRTSCK